MSVEKFKEEMKATVQAELENHLNKNQESPLFTINQVAKRLGMAHSTIKKLVHSGAIKSTRNGRITEESITDFLENK